MAENGEIDAGILAAADYFVHEDRYEPIAGLGVANREEVRSILFLSRRPMAELDGVRIGITEETSTSVRLLRVLLELRDGIRPSEYVRGLRDEGAAFLVIGNEALRRNTTTTPAFPYRYDLATEWWNWTGLPFVFALWAVRRSLPEETKGELAELLERSFVLGMSQLDQIAAEFAGELGGREVLASYLRNFHYRLGAEEMKGFEEFRRLTRENHFLDPI